MRVLFQLDLPNADGSVAIAQAACLCAADQLRLAPEKRIRLELAVEEVVVNAVRHAYPPGVSGLLRVTASVEGAVLTVRVQDWGLPYDPSEITPFSVEDPQLRGLGLHLAWCCCDEAVLRNLGRDGKVFSLRFRLPPSPVPVPEPAVPAARGAGRVEADVRLFTPADAPGVARCAWLAYGYSKPDDHLYDPTELARLNRDGLMIGIVAVGGDGGVVAHACLDLSENPLVPEFTDLVIAPAARGNPMLLGRILQLGYDTAVARGCLGVLVNAVTAHTVSQRGALRFGGVPIQVHLASVSPEWDLTAGSGKEDGAGAGGKAAVRQSEIALYCRNRIGEPRLLHCPERHRAMLRSIFAAFGEPVTIADAAPPEPASLPPASDLLVESGLLAWGHVLIDVRAYGQDLISSVAAFLRRFCQDGVATVLLQLPLGDPATPGMADRLERLGFSFAGIFPQAVSKAGAPGQDAGPAGPDTDTDPGRAADIILFQYLNNVSVDPASERIASACQPLYDYVMAERRRVDRELYALSDME
ncbi:anti-sigma regulatory factor (Ser/Thr protein kinase) [Azospirillum agricola]|uniref:ATP-binding protein n=1 Tax=Azospirillum agricola TaxID=1720247 RepID=UPI001AEA0213|nr:ATP-binding protein [Azospirillum agricola]MBP2233147.1 anti-sigma regulatory factor (Ser/Thr protein kinase) [Azospirillum agricola]